MRELDPALPVYDVRTLTEPVETLRAIALLVKLHLIRGPIALSVWVGVPLVLLLVATIASWLPARRATQVDVMVALRQE